jgi:transcriptional regulator with XRE-family HTH domain
MARSRTTSTSAAVGLADLPPTVREHAQVFLERLARLCQSEHEDAVGLRQDIQLAALQAANAANAEANKSRQHLPTTYELQKFVGMNIKRLRDSAGWTQDELAQAMTTLGFDWKRITVAEVERGARRTGLDELVGLAALFAEPVAMLLAPHPGNYVKFPGNRALDPTDVAQLLLGPGVEARSGDDRWEPAQRVAGVGEGVDDRRPVADLARRAAQGYGRRS